MAAEPRNEVPEGGQDNRQMELQWLQDVGLETSGSKLADEEVRDWAERWKAAWKESCLKCVD